MRVGYDLWEPDEHERPICPRCQTELNFDDKVFRMDGKIIGCEFCIDVYDTEDAEDYF